MIQQVKTTAWNNDKGRELVRLKEDGTAQVLPAFADAEMLDDLAEACVAAATALRLIDETKQETAA